MYRYAYHMPNDEIIISKAYSDWDECFQSYVKEMEMLAAESDIQLSTFYWRGVFTNKQLWYNILTATGEQNQ